MFKKKVLNVVKDIPKGQTLSYKQVAEKAGSQRAWGARKKKQLLEKEIRFNHMV